MEINTPYLHIRDDAEFAVRLNTVRPGRPFAIIDLSEDGRTGLTVESAEEIDRLIRAATEAKRLLAGASAAADLDRAIAADLDEQTADSDRCPSCESPQPGMHPATQADGGEVLYICPDPWHTTDEQLRRDGEALGRRIAADEGIEPKADPVPWPTGLCGHPVPPGAWAAGFRYCRADAPIEYRDQFDRAARKLTAVDDEDGEQR